MINDPLRQGWRSGALRDEFTACRGNYSCCPSPSVQHKKARSVSYGLFTIRNTDLFNTLTTQIIFVVTTEVDDLLRGDFQNTPRQ